MVPVRIALLALSLIVPGHGTVLAQSSLAPTQGSLPPPRPASPTPPRAEPARPPAAPPAARTTPAPAPRATTPPRETQAPARPQARPPAQAQTLPRTPPQAQQATPRPAQPRPAQTRPAQPRPGQRPASAAPPTVGRATPPPSRRPGAAAAGAAAGAAAAGAAAGAAAARPPEPVRPPPPPVPSVGSVTGLPLPRFAALRSDEVNMRVGPSTSYPIEWTFQRRDLPVQIIGEFQLWRRIRDADGTEGWVHSSTLAGRRTALVRPTAGTEASLRRRAEANANTVAHLRPGVIARIRECRADSGWCEIQVANHRGFLRRADIWGVGADEEIK